LLITVSGPPGSGTTTTARHVAARLELDLLPGGEVFRAMAAERSMTLAEFGSYAADHPDVDVELDGRLADRARTGAVVIESRLAGWIARQEGLPALRVYVDCDPRIRAERVAGRDGTPVARALADNRQRETVERDRYLALYGVDVDDRSIYDIVVDSGSLTADEVADHVVDAARARFV
jgi:predicted cytidylate kinase